jgi:hypothetical protein
MRHIVAYLLFVGGPLLGLLGVLRVGRGIDAPMAVHGTYAVVPHDSSLPGCYRYLLAANDSTLRLRQSGAQLTATLGPEQEVVLRGALTGEHVRLGGVIEAVAADSVSCREGDALRVTARVIRDARSTRLDGELEASGCTECGPMRITGTRPRGHALQRIR